MLIIFIVALFVIHFQLGHSEYSNAITIGNYPNVTMNTCGLGRESRTIDVTCFKYHDNFNFGSSLMQGRNVTRGEVPYVVRIMIGSGRGAQTCTGSILNKDWIITAAHCCTGKAMGVAAGIINYADLQKPNAKIIKVKECVKHKEYNFRKQGGTAWDGSIADIALLRLEKSIAFNATELYQVSNGICLPQCWQYGEQEEYALITGWGKYKPGYSNMGPLQMGWTKILKYAEDGQGGQFYEDAEADNTIIIKMSPARFGSYGCEGDSGSPLVQFVNDRAVLVGVLSQHKGQEINACPDPNDRHSRIRYTRVSTFIDWILCVIGGDYQQNKCEMRCGFKKVKTY